MTSQLDKSPLLTTKYTDLNTPVTQWKLSDQKSNNRKVLKEILYKITNFKDSDAVVPYSYRSVLHGTRLSFRETQDNYPPSVTNLHVQVQLQLRSLESPHHTYITKSIRSLFNELPIMTRSYRFLSSTGNSSSSSDQATAEPPEAVAAESDFVVILAALLCALICVLGLISVARCAWLRRGPTSNTRRNPSQTAANKGIKKKIVETLPKFVYNSGTDENAGKLSTGDCAICLAEYVDGDEIRVLPQCGHGFHVGCIDMWLGSHSSCPSCRQILAISRCRKCGEFPTVSGSTELERKGRQHDNTSCSSNYLP
ncbi:hypothetical protein L1987_74689 [Smallanthus sonchifolius]|uniref:Uncharacterized protein n=1 Tax=Smallanthus sonchifolius TaxID=185202 RepID=A0ACB9A4A2_9ASTR|nr:hypothetical protein L1987_74689 [Smallanthus sonchifolius]